MKKNFALIGAAGYIAPRHLRAIQDTKNKLRVALDPHDSVGILDQYFPDADFFTEFERFDRHVEKLRRRGEPERIHYITICSPNYLHDAHIRFALRVGANAICEKPVVLNPWNIDALQELERESGAKVFTVLQLRLHPTLVALKEKIQKPGATPRRHKIKLTYVTSRGNWYLHSWKGMTEKSGGLATNIGIHFFDLLTWIFGQPKAIELHVSTERQMAGILQLEHADVQWFLSIDKNDLPTKATKTTFRQLEISGESIEFSEGFTDLHTKAYQNILTGKGFSLEDARPAVTLVHKLRTMAPQRPRGATHPFAKKYTS